MKNQGGVKWTPGTTGTPDAGAVSFNHYVHDTQHWLDGGDFGTSDYDADASPPTITTDTTAYKHWVIDLKPEWATDWRDGTRESNGLVLLGESGGNNYLASIDNSNAAYRPHFEIDYTPDGGPPAFFLSRRSKN
jgi:hypothetical protein